MSSVDQFILSFSKMTTFLPQLGNQQPSLPILKPHAQAHLLSPTDKCKICAEPAARHVHYGATTCFSCRAFFRRSLQNKTAAKYACMRHSMCQMNIKTRKNCQYCRYMKCLAIGMNPNYVLSEEERKRRFKKRNNSINEEVAFEEKNCMVPVIKSVTLNKKQTSNLKGTKEEIKPEPVDNIQSETIFKQEDDNYINKMRTILPLNLQSGTKYFNILQMDKKFQHQSGSKIELDGYKFPCQAPPADQGQMRRSIIMRLENKMSNSKVCAANKYKDKEVETKISFIQPAQLKILQDEATNTYLNNDIKPKIQLTEYSMMSSPPKIEKEYKGLISEESKHDESSENDTSYESEDDKSLVIMMNKEPEIVFSEDEKNQLDQLVRDHDTVYHSVNFGEVLIKEMLMCSMFGVAVSTSAAIQGYRLQVERLTRIANTLKCFTSLPKLDQVSLLKENADLLVSLRGAIFFNKKKKGMDQVLSSMGKDDLDIIEKMFKPMIQNHFMNHIDYNVFNSIQDPGNKKTEERYSFLQGKVADSILDNITTILVTYVILFSSDFCSLMDRKTVEKTQDYYLRILHRCIYSAGSRYRACNRMANTLNAVTCVREMADIKKNRSINPNATAQIRT